MLIRRKVSEIGPLGFMAVLKAVGIQSPSHTAVIGNVMLIMNG